MECVIEKYIFDIDVMGCGGYLRIVLYFFFLCVMMFSLIFFFVVLDYLKEIFFKEEDCVLCFVNVEYFCCCFVNFFCCEGFCVKKEKLFICFVKILCFILCLIEVLVWFLVVLLFSEYLIKSKFFLEFYVIVLFISLECLVIFFIL